VYFRVSFRVTVSINCSSNTVPAMHLQGDAKPAERRRPVFLFYRRTVKTETPMHFDRNMTLQFS